MSHISVSQIGMFARCQVQWRFRYLDGLIRPPSSAMLVGGGAHGGFEHGMRHKAETGGNTPANEVRDAAVAEFDGRIGESDVLLTRDEQSRGRSSVVGECRDRVAALGHFWALAVQPAYHPASVEAVERRFDLPIPGYSQSLVGVIDLVTESGRVVDWKTTRSNAPSQAEADNSLQLTAYCLAVQRMEIVPRSGSTMHADASLHVLKEAEAGTKHMAISTSRDRSDYEPFLRRVCSTIRAIERATRVGDFLPCNTPGQYPCTQDWCGYWSQCPFQKH